MDVCVFCGQAVRPASDGQELTWLSADGASTCTTGATGAHYPGHEADLFWRGSAMIDLTRDEPQVDLRAPATTEAVEEN